MKTLLKMLALPLALTLGLSAFADDEKGEEPQAKAPTPREVAEAQLPSYPLTTCVVGGEQLEAGATVDFVLDGRLYRLCCNDCKAVLEKDPAKYEAKIVAAVIADQAPRYPSQACAVSGEPLGSMGDPIDYVDGTKLVRFCCKGCVRGYEKDPAKYMAAVDQAWITAQLESYPLTTCLVMEGDPLEDPEADTEPVDMLYGTRLVRLCCKSCVKRFKKDPAKYIAALDAASKAPAETPAKTPAKTPADTK